MKILITGGSGLIGTHLTERLIAKHYEVVHLSRSPRRSSAKTFSWKPDERFIDSEALKGVNVVVHLAGAGIADKRWNKRYKEEILTSRAATARLLVETLRGSKHDVTTFVSSSGISYYGTGDPTRNAFAEWDPPGNDYMAYVTVEWEREVAIVKELGIRPVMIRTGLVLTRNGGALDKLTMPVKWLVGAPLGSGSQWINWIHINDLCDIYIKAIEDTLMEGPYNAVAPNPVSNKELTREIARVLKRPLWLPNVPGFVVRMIAGEVAEVVLKGGKVSSKKIEDAGFRFQYRDIEPALRDLLK
jgi:uncharacterized protein (TIGR01777 family)